MTRRTVMQLGRERAAHRLWQRPVQKGGAALAHADGELVRDAIAADELAREVAEQVVQALEQRGLCPGTALQLQVARVRAGPAGRMQVGGSRASSAPRSSSSKQTGKHAAC